MAKKQRQNTRKPGVINANVGTVSSGGAGASPQSTTESTSHQSPVQSQQQPSTSPPIQSQRRVHTLPLPADENIPTLKLIPRQQSQNVAFDQYSSSSSTQQRHKSLWDWIQAEREGILWILGCATIGALLGFGVGCGWFTGGAGTYHYTYDIINDVPIVSQKRYVVAGWRVALAARIRRTMAYELVTLRKSPLDLFSFALGQNKDKLHELHPSQSSQSWDSLFPLWPPKWVFFDNVDISKIDVGDGGLSPIMVSFLSFVLPWRRPLIQALARKEKKNLKFEPSSVPTRPPSSYPDHESTQAAISVDPYSHNTAFHVLREYVIRFEGGYVHPDIGFLVPAPSGAARGIGMVRDSYNKCQRQCSPGSADEKRLNEEQKDKNNLEQNEKSSFEREYGTVEEVGSSLNRTHPLTGSQEPVTARKETKLDKDQLLFQGRSPTSLRHETTSFEQVQSELQSQSRAKYRYSQEDIILKIPLDAQITRTTAIQTLDALIPLDVRNRVPILELDDAVLLALLLAHELGLGSDSRFWPYIATLPPNPSCGWNKNLRQSVVDVVTAMAVEMGTDVQGWPSEIAKAADFAERVEVTLARDYGQYLAKRTGFENVAENISWSLCQVASRAVAGKDSYGMLRLVPMMDMINHDEAAGKFVELTGDECLEKGGFVDSNEEDAGAFVVRSLRHGRKKTLKKGQELLANYNVPNYSPIDWFLNMGYIPPERSGKWTMLEAGLPHTFRGGFSRANTSGSKPPSGAFGSGKPEIQVIRQHTQQCQRCSQ